MWPPPPNRVDSNCSQGAQLLGKGNCALCSPRSSECDRCGKLKWPTSGITPVNRLAEKVPPMVGMGTSGGLNGVV